MRVCVFAASSSAVAEPYVLAARELGRLIATRGHTLVFGGGDVGLMGEVARSARQGGAAVVGVLPRAMQERGLPHALSTELVLTETLAERKAAMEARSDAFVALPGGLGTLDELAQTLSLLELGYLRAPLVLVNVDDFYRHLLAHLERLFALRFAHAEYRRLYHVAATSAEALDYVEAWAHAPPELPDKVRLARPPDQASADHAGQ